MSLDLVYEVVPEIKRIMETTIQLSLPFTVDPQIGENWIDKVDF